ncbi:lysoplasmalogenase family protein [uncultured Flavonifractor sp.]|uniref:lysoplasmalogenase family protein n=1 Tax=uncultured Flavonifractor sp. TaxID=1193534 RepID=UPI00261E9004|nr:lysoplasmalogenase family protein [uncultured Flavonifractor sp.]
MRGTDRRELLPFLAAQGVLYAAFLWLDLFRPGSGWDVPLKYLSILLCFCRLVRLPQNADGRLTRAALAFTLLADLFLLVLNRWYGAGVAAFCVVQALYLARIHRAGGRPLALRLALRGALAGLLLAAGAGLGALNGLTALTLLYFSQLAANALASLSLGRRGRSFAAGLFLFVGCDLCVGLCNLSPLLPGAPVLVLLPFARVGMWLFYLPSQVLLTLSAGKLCD